MLRGRVENKNLFLEIFILYLFALVYDETTSFPGPSLSAHAII